MSTLKQTRQDKIFDIVNYTLLGLFLLAVLYPLYFIVIASFSDPTAINSGQVWFWPKDITFEGYERILGDSAIWRAYRNSLFYTALGTTINLFLTLTAAYSLSRRDLVGRNFFMFMFALTMFFSGGLIPTYLVVRDLGMINTIWALVIPNAVSVWNIIIARTFFETTIPHELLEAAQIDGCSNTKFFLKIALPLAKPLIAIMVLFYGVGHWNAFFDALIYLRDEALYPLQIILRNILIQQEMSAQMVMDVESYVAQHRVAELVKYGVIMVASVPPLILYPFIQKYFVKGVFVGSIKG
jgi:putative aldouronate transport system permease protein